MQTKRVTAIVVAALLALLLLIGQAEAKPDRWCTGGNRCVDPIVGPMVEPEFPELP